MERKLWTRGEKIFQVFDILLVAFLALICFLPLMNVVALSFSDKASTAAGKVTFWPVHFQLTAYEQIFKNKYFLSSLMISVLRVLIGVPLQMFFVVMGAYPLSLSNKQLKGRDFFVWFFFFTNLFGGGMIPTYIQMKNLHLLNNIWILVINGGLFSVGNCLLMMNFIRRLPRSLFEAAEIDGAGHMTILFKICLPLSMASIATLMLFSGVGLWNEWFSATIYLSDASMYPLQTRLREMIINTDFSKMSKEEMEV